MKMKIDLSGITSLFKGIGRALKNAAPEIAIVGGTVGLIAAGVVACKETPKAMKTVEEHKQKLAKIELAENKGATEIGEPYSAEDAAHDKKIIFVQDGATLVKAYAPAAILALLSAASIFAGGKIFRKRVTALTGAYALLEKNFSKYREGVIERFGSDMDKELRYKLKTKTYAKDENGGEASEVKTTEYDGHSDYARFFDEWNPNWKKDGGRNLAFLIDQQAYANDLLRINGVLFLNDVYKSLGIPKTPEGQLVGWVYDPDDDSIDSYVDFGITDILNNKHKIGDIMMNAERSFLLDFNCDGRILEKFTKYERQPAYGCRGL